MMHNAATFQDLNVIASATMDLHSKNPRRSAVDSSNVTSTSISCLQSYPNGLRLANIWSAICFVLPQNEILQLHCEGFSYI